MDPRLTNFFQYDYTEARIVATTMLTMSGGGLAGSILFVHQFLGLHKIRNPHMFNLGMAGIYCFVAASFCAVLALLMNYMGMLGLLHKYQDGIANRDLFMAEVSRRDLQSIINFFVAGICMLFGCFFLYMVVKLYNRERVTVAQKV